MPQSLSPSSHGVQPLACESQQISGQPIWNLNVLSLRWPHASWLLPELVYPIAVCNVQDTVSHPNIKMCGTPIPRFGLDEGLIVTLASPIADLLSILSSCPFLPIWWDNTQKAQCILFFIHISVCFLSLQSWRDVKLCLEPALGLDILMVGRRE